MLSAARKTTLAAAALAAVVLTTPGVATAAPAASAIYAQVTNDSLVFQGQPSFELAANAGDTSSTR